MDKIYGVLRNIWNKLRVLLGWIVNKEGGKNKGIKNSVLTLFMAFAGKICKAKVRFLSKAVASQTTTTP